MFQQLILWVKNLFGKKTGQKVSGELKNSEEHKKRYEDHLTANFTAMFSNSLANKTVTDANMTVTDAADGVGLRSEFIAAALAPIWENIKKIVSQALGKGGKFLIPYLDGSRVFVDVVDKDRVMIIDSNGAGDITEMSVVAETKEVDGDTYKRVVYYSLQDAGVTIKTVAVDRYGKEVALAIVPDWAELIEEINIGGVDRLPVAFLKCPKDSRKENDDYGVPITFGSEDTIRQIHECLEQIEKEYGEKRVKVFADEFLFGKDNRLTQDDLFKVFRTGGSLDGKPFYELFDPAIRDSAYYVRYNSLCLQLEKEVGTSKGILTEPSTMGATATEIRAANHDTFSLVSDIRKNIEKCFDNLAYAVDVYAEFFGLTPRNGGLGDYKITFDWDMSLVESSAETFEQLSELESRGLISGARLNSWVTGQSMEDAQAEIDAVNEQNAKSTSTMLEPTDFEPT